jgi:hypothetical protein
MNNAELIAALKDAEGYIIYVAPNCFASCEAIKAIRSAADALEAAEKRIAELEAQLPKEGEWVVDKKGYPQIICSLCGVHIPMVAGWCMDAHINYCPNCGARMDGEQE